MRGPRDKIGTDGTFSSLGALILLRLFPGSDEKRDQNPTIKFGTSITSAAKDICDSEIR
jgi:hypothetical protein